MEEGRKGGREEGWRKDGGGIEGGRDRRREGQREGGTEGGRASSLFLALCRWGILVVSLSCGLVIMLSFHLPAVLSSSHIVTVLVWRIVVPCAWDRGVVWSSFGLAWWSSGWWWRHLHVVVV